MAKETLYDILGIKPEATEQELKSAYREGVKKHHPDIGDGDRNAFERIQRAYEILSDAEKRKKYNAIAKIISEKPKPQVDPWGMNVNVNVGGRNSGSSYSFSINANWATASGSSTTGRWWSSGSYMYAAKQTMSFTLPAVSVGNNFQVGDIVNVYATNGSVLGNASSPFTVGGIRPAVSTYGCWVIKSIQFISMGHPNSTMVEFILESI